MSSPHGDRSTDVRHHDSPFLPHSDNVFLVIVNSPIPKSPLFQKLWDMSSFRICADGGANRLFEVSESTYIPDVIRGDLDSLLPHVRSYYEERGTTVEQDPDQDSNDLDKALQLVATRLGNKENIRVCVYGAFGGRFDQEMASIQALYRWSDKFNGKLLLINDETCAFLLPPVIRNEIRLPFYGEAPINEDEDVSETLVGEGPTCGLIPIGCRCEFVHTTGLKWNLDGNVALEFGGIVSSSNRAMEEVVTVQASHPLVFTAEVTAGTSGQGS